MNMNIGWQRSVWKLVTTGDLLVACVKSPPADLVIGNSERVENPTVSAEDVCVVTRQQKARESKPLKVVPQISDIDTEQFQEYVERDSTLERYKQQAHDGIEGNVGKTGKQSFELQGGLLYRKFTSTKVNAGTPLRQLIVPKPLREKVLQLAHANQISDGPTALALLLCEERLRQLVDGKAT